MNFKDVSLNGADKKLGWFKGTLSELSSFSISFLTVEDRDAFVSLFPKFCKVRATFISYCCESKSYPSAWVDMSVSVDKRTGEKNETAIKRRDKIIEVLSKNHIDPITL